MNSFPMERYRFYEAGNKVIAVSTYGKKRVKGVATCHPFDKYELELGKQLAAARCNEKVAIKRYARAQNKYAEALKARDEAEKLVNKMKEYINDSYIAMNEASQGIDNIMKYIENHT